MTALLMLLALSRPATCTVVSLHPDVRLVCQGASTAEFAISEWPEDVWPGGAHLTGVYNAVEAAGEFWPVATPRNLTREQNIRARTLAEGRRWRRQPLQQLR